MILPETPLFSSFASALPSHRYGCPMAASPAFTLASALRSGKPVFTAWCGLASPIVAELIAREGFSAVVLDQQHGLYDMETTIPAIAAVEAEAAV